MYCMLTQEHACCYTLTYQHVYWWRLACPRNNVQCARGGCCPSLINSMLWLHAATVVEGVLRYLGLGMIYQAGICTIVISMNRTFKRCTICHRLNSVQSRENLWRKMWPTLKTSFMTSFGSVIQSLAQLYLSRCSHWADPTRVWPVYNHQNSD